MTVLDHFAERLSQHGSVSRAARQLGKSESWGQEQLLQLVAKYGWQAE